MKSLNTLNIISIESFVKNDDDQSYFKSKFTAELNFVCPETNINFKKWTFSSIGKGNVAVEAIIEAILNFNFGLMEIKTSDFKTDEIKCEVNFSTIDYIENSLKSPFRDIFKKYVDLNEWKDRLFKL